MAALSANERSEEHTSELQSLRHVVCRLLLEQKKLYLVYSRRLPSCVSACFSAPALIFILSLHDALPISPFLLPLDEGWNHAAMPARAIPPTGCRRLRSAAGCAMSPAERRQWQRCRQTRDRKSTRLNSSHLGTSYAVFCLNKKNYISSTLAVSLRAFLLASPRPP